MSRSNPIRCAALAVSLLALFAAPSAFAARAVNAPPATDRALVVGLDAEGAERWRAALEPAPRPDAAPTTRSTLESTTWYPPFPDIEIQLFDGGAFDPRDARGDVLLIDFWASWCEPCLRELPQLQELADEWHGRGLRVITVNSGEPRLIALDYLDALGVTLPAGSYDRVLREALPVRSLPTMVLVDPQGRMRQRWNGYSEGLIEQVVERVVELLDPATSGRETVAEVTDGHGLLRVDWARRTGNAAGLAIIPVEPATPVADDGDADTVEPADTPGVSPSIVAASGSQLIVLDDQGEIDRRVPADQATGVLRHASGGLLGFRPGGRRIVRLDRALSGEALDVPSYVLDVADVPGGAEDDARPWVATTDGLRRHAGDGWQSVGDPSEFRAVAAVGDRVAALRAPALLAWYGADGQPAGERELSIDDAWHLLADADGGLISADGRVTQIVQTRVVPGRGAVLAVATSGGVLALLDPADGTLLHRSLWERLGPLTGGDLDGDGVDELVLSAGGRVYLLRWAGE